MAKQLEGLVSDVVEEPQTSSMPGLLSVAWQHKYLVVLGGVVGLILGGLSTTRLKPVYQTSAQVMVVKKHPDALPLPGTDQSMSYTEDYLSTHQVLIRSPLIVSGAIRKGNINSLPSFAGNDNPTGTIIEGLTIIREGGKDSTPTNILRLSYRSADPEDADVVLNAVIKSYKDFLDETYKNVSDDTLKQITKAREVLETSLAKKEAEYRNFRSKNFALWKGKDGTTVLHDRLFGLEAKRSALLARKAEIGGRVIAFEGAIQSGRSPDELLALVSESTAKLKRESGEITQAGQNQLATLVLDEQTLLEDYGPDHPKVRSVRRQIEMLRTNANRLDKLTSSSSEPRKPTPAQAHLQALKRELEDINVSEQALTTLLQSEQTEARKLISQEIQEDAYRTDISRQQQLFESIVKHLEKISIMKDFGGYDAQCIAPPGPGLKSLPNGNATLGLGCLLGLLGGLGLGYLVELADQSFRTPEDVRQRLGLPVVGQVPVLPAARATSPQDGVAVGLAPTLYAHHQPRSKAAEAYRGVRTAVYFNARGKGHRVIQITSPSMGDGKSTLAANLSVSMAQSRKTVILVDADLRRPCVHKMFGLEPEFGLTSVLTGEMELAEVILPTGIPGLSVLPCGLIPPNPADLLNLPRFKELLDHLREQYDYVIVDTPPLLAVTDPSIVVPHVDGVILTVRLARQARSAARRAQEILASLGTAVFGVVVNGVKAGVGYGYGDGANTSYYAEDTQDASITPRGKKSKTQPIPNGECVPTGG